MIVFCVLFTALLLLLTGTLVAFGDLIIFGLIIYGLMKLFKKKK